ncbi:MAG: EVE domain-containing protein [Leptolyngbyaceae cyanobacterium bins.349]|nr:EVE domain-containing protein [Leptolyngbyaceae cyanobacterium bins.349]
MKDFSTNSPPSLSNMAVHIFVLNQKNFTTCIQRGVAAIPDAERSHINDQLISRMASIRRGDLILFYVTGKKEIYGVYKALDKAFYDESKVWESEDSQVYPFRVRIDNTNYVFEKPILLSDIYDLRDNGRIWTFGLISPTGRVNSMFSISEIEYEEVLQLFLKANQILKEPIHISEPYRHVEPNILSKLTFDEKQQPKYEATLASLFLDSISRKCHTEIFGEYSDYLSYIPTSFQKEIDVLLLHSYPGKKELVFAYSIIELKKDSFNEDGLSQLLRYEDWFLKKRVNGDSRSIRTVAIARTFHNDVIQYLQRREKLEGKQVTLLKYKVLEGKLNFEQQIVELML